MNLGRTRFGARLARFRTLPGAERVLLARAAVLLGLVALAVRCLPLTSVRRRLEGLDPRWRTREPVRVDRVAWAVTVAGRYIPGARTCLPQALVTEALLRCAGEDARLCIGVARSEHGLFRGHAWVEARGRVMIGGGERDRYTVLTALERGCEGRAPLRT